MQAGEDSRPQYPILLTGRYCEVFAGSVFSLEQMSWCGFVSRGSSGIASSAFLRLKVCHDW